MIDVQVEYGIVNQSQDNSVVDPFGDNKTNKSSSLYKYMISPTYKGLSFTYSSQMNAPDLIQNYYVGNHFLWSKKFNNYRVDKIELSYKIKKGATQAQPFVGYDKYKDLIYYDSLATPSQDQGTITAPYAGVDFKSSWRRFHLSGFFKYYNPSDINIVRAPKIFLYQQVYYESHFQNNLFFQLGADIYMRSSYDAYAFMPATQQFYTRNKDVKNASTVVVDAFINFRLKSALLFLKVPAVNHLISGRGYFLTPDYPGVKSTFVFGVEWMFFD